LPHLGTLIGSVLSADVFARYLRLRGEEVLFVSGSDEHGTPIEIEAIKRRVHPKTLTDEVHSLVTDLFKRFSISFDNYTRTHNDIHINFCRELFLRIYEKGFIYARDVDQLFCETCKRFLPDRFVIGTCPKCGYPSARGDQCENCGIVLEPLELVDYRCSICGSIPVIKKTKHWYFDLPRFSEKLRTMILNNDRLPENAKNFSLSWINEGLRPRAVTRDNQWGIPAPFPGAEGKTIYVWFEAVIGYVTATIEWSLMRGNQELWKKYWLDPETKSVYFIGKDNIPFHTIILPALLMAYDERFVLPWNVSSTEYLMFEGQKFSKSRGVGIWLDQALSYFPADYWRYYLIKIRPEKSDTNFSWDDFQKTINNDLNDNIGNFVHRVLTFIYNHYGGEIPKPHAFDESDNDLLSHIKATPIESGRYLDELKMRQALEVITELSSQGNVYLTRKEPWHSIKKEPEKAETTLYVASQVVKSLSILLEPFIPESAAKIRDMLDLKIQERDAWFSAGETPLRPGHKINRPKPLFEKIPDSKIAELKNKTKG